MVARILIVGLFAQLAAGAWAADPEPKILPPQDVTLKTNDGVAIAATFYPSKLGKNAVPVILLHAAKGNRGDLDTLARKLQVDGHAVIAPDLRGHGDSGSSNERSSELRIGDYEAMVTQDMEAVKRFLLAKNNAGELNIEKLCVVGIELGSIVAINWAAQDWSWPALSSGKQGQHVKALVLISPEWTHKGLRINEALGDPHVRADLSVLMVTGKGSSKLLAESKRLYSAFERYHAPVSAEEAGKKQTLYLRTPQTSLQGARLLNETSLHVDQIISQFIDVRLTRQQIPWSEAKSAFN